ncbi:MAG: hypothetical protein MZV70_64080 [Desulfobacterales bacterium]|nr:hypothetical protein [Desulfobacterales bacterium]
MDEMEMNNMENEQKKLSEEYIAALLRYRNDLLRCWRERYGAPYPYKSPQAHMDRGGHGRGGQGQVRG